MADTPRFQFRLITLFGIVTFAAVALMLLKHEVLFVLFVLAVAAPMAFFVSVGTVVFSAALVRDVGTAIVRRSWRPLRVWASWGVVFLLTYTFFLAVWLLGFPEALNEPNNKRLAFWLIVFGACMGVGAAVLHVRRRQFWTQPEVQSANTY
jgi:hypothetical protein